MDFKYLTEELILSQMKKSNLITKIFLGMYDSNNIYDQSIKYLKDDIYKIIKDSDLVKTIEILLEKFYIDDNFCA